jgi:hypothetical protein
MTSFRQVEANRRNVRKSTGPTTDEGKQHSRCNAVRHGLTAETVIGALEDAEDYKAFEAAVIADYDAQSAVESELVLRLASLPWRLRRATTMETGYSRFRLIIWAHSGSRTKFAQALEGLSMPYLEVLTQAVSTQIQHRTPVRTNLETYPSKQLCISPANSHVAFCDSPICPTTRSTRYEATPWRQAGQILFALDILGRRKPV